MMTTAKRTKLSAAILATLMLGGCALQERSPMAESIKKDHQQTFDRSVELYSQAQNQQRSQPKLQKLDRFYADTRIRQRQAGEWLSKIPFELQVARDSQLDLKELTRVFASQGVNVISPFPLDQYSYTGLSISKTNALDALKIISASMGFDFIPDDASRTVRLATLPTKQYSIALNNRSSSFNSGGSGGASSGSGAETSGDGASASGSGGIVTENNFWESLTQELEDRCQTLVPKPSGGANSNIPSVNNAINNVNLAAPDQTLVASLANPGAGNATISSGSDFEERTICRSTINPTTGTVTVQAPTWVQQELGSYFADLNDELSTRLTLSMKIILVRTTEQESRGLDLSAFAGSLEKYGLAVQNNVLGGLTLSATGNRAGVTASGALANSFIGARINGAQAFIGWLESIGEVAIENEPVLSTVSGVPTSFNRTSPVVYFRYSQQSTPNEGGTVSVSIDTEEVEKSVGSVINVNPKIDMERGTIRTQLSINQKYLTGWKDAESYLADGAGGITPIPLEIPLIEEININGEFLLRDGETIIVGGQRFSTTNNNESGITKLKDSPVGSLFGKANSDREVLTYYAVLTANLDRTTTRDSERNRVALVR